MSQLYSTGKYDRCAYDTTPLATILRAKILIMNIFFIAILPNSNFFLLDFDNRASFIIYYLL